MHKFFVRLRSALWGAFCLCVCGPAPAWADGWQALLYDTATPPRVVAVDKSRQTFLFYEKKSPLAMKFSYPCTTGQVDGDKQVINDLRTPEGVYFVEYKIASGLDFKEYGGIAYTLNYPNPVDKLRGKTGHGIWIHSKGFGIVPKDTRGCVAIGLQEIDEVGPLLSPGTPVLLAETVPTAQIPLRDEGIVQHLRMRMEQWTRAWAARSPKLFDFYDSEAYTKAMPESFAAFKLNKERLFRTLSWINIFNRNVHVLQGPGYWVTWSEQFYRASNLSTEGIRRLYWQQGKDNKFRIVGMEWTPRDVGMRADFLKGRLVASADAGLSDAASEAPLPPRLDMPETPDAQPAPPAPAPQTVPGQAVAAATLAAPVPPEPKPASVAPQAPVEPRPVAAPAALALDQATVRALQDAMNRWSDAWQNRSDDFFVFYDQAQYGKVKIPGKGGDSFRALKADMQRRFRTSPWIHIFNRPIQVETDKDLAVTWCEQLVRVPGQAPAQGVRRLFWQRGGDGIFRIVGSQWESADLGLEADYLEAVTGQVGVVLEAWRKAWESGNADAYIRFYQPQARQQGRTGAQNIAQSKARIWEKAAPASVQFSGLRIQTDPHGVRVDMTQVYRDSTGRGDKGTKTLLLQPAGGTWRILSEDWSGLPIQNGAAPVAAVAPAPQAAAAMPARRDKGPGASLAPSGRQGEKYLRRAQGRL